MAKFKPFRREEGRKVGRFRMTVTARPGKDPDFDYQIWIVSADGDPIGETGGDLAPILTAQQEQALTGLMTALLTKADEVL